ncbi:hypothetical protein Hanom_Chr16g01485831 [Helianthus anomalus]
MFSSLEMNKWYRYQISQTNSSFGTDSVLKFSDFCTIFYLQISVNTGYFQYQYPFFWIFGIGWYRAQSCSPSLVRFVQSMV